jgi:glyoxylase-like metal-dependent hydrolase (beta-lactamase superfamily II)
MKLLSAALCQLAFTAGILAQTLPRNVYEIYALEYAASKGRAALKDVAVGATTADSTTFSYYVWFLKGDSGRRVLVDTGFLLDSAGASKSMVRYERPDLALKKLHVNANEVTDVIITHPHHDHIGWITLFKNATVWMQKLDYEYFVGGAWQPGAEAPGLHKEDVLATVQVNLDGRLRLLAGDSLEIMPGIRAFIGSKHTRESQHLLVDTGAEKVLLASDDVWFYCNLENLLSVPLTFDQGAYVRQMRRMKALVSDPELIIPGHDPLVLVKFPQVARGVVRIR